MSNYTLHIPECDLVELLYDEPIRASRKFSKYAKTVKTITKPSKSKLRGSYESTKRN